MTEKKKPTYDLEAFQAAFSAVEALNMTFTADTVTFFKLLSFQEKDNGEQNWPRPH